MVCVCWSPRISQHFFSNIGVKESKMSKESVVIINLVSERTKQEHAEIKSLVGCAKVKTNRSFRLRSANYALVSIINFSVSIFVHKFYMSRCAGASLIKSRSFSFVLKQSVLREAIESRNRATYLPYVYYTKSQVDSWCEK